MCFDTSVFPLKASHCDAYDWMYIVHEWNICTIAFKDKYNMYIGQTRILLYQIWDHLAYGVTIPHQNIYNIKIPGFHSILFKMNLACHHALLFIFTHIHTCSVYITVDFSLWLKTISKVHILSHNYLRIFQQWRWECLKILTMSSLKLNYYSNNMCQLYFHTLKIKWVYLLHDSTLSHVDSWLSLQYFTSRCQVSSLLM